MLIHKIVFPKQIHPKHNRSTTSMFGSDNGRTMIVNLEMQFSENSGNSKITISDWEKEGTKPRTL